MYNHHFSQLCKDIKRAYCFMAESISKTDLKTALVLVKDLAKKDPRLFAGLNAVLDFHSNITKDPNLLKLESQFIATGPKLYMLSPLTCESLENVELNFSMNEYRQPFPIIGLDYSKEHWEQRYIKNNIFLPLHDKDLGTFHLVPDYALMKCDKDSSRIDLAVRMKTLEKMKGCLISYLTISVDNNSEKTLEECFDKELESKETLLNQEEKIFLKSIFRTICNMSMIILDKGQQEIPNKYREKLAARVSKGIKNKDDEFELRVHPQVFTFKQNIKLFQQQNDYENEGNKTGIKVKPHWRSGHWRDQRYGTGRASVRRKLILPIFVNKQYFNGNLSDTVVNYRE
jgi:hypothetical protein